jgi:hypothetical protein
MTFLLRSHRFVRLLAAWLLLWFLVMAMPQPLPLQVAPLADPCPAAGVGAIEEAHAGGHAPACEAAQQPGLHAGHGAGATSHCPLCLHAAAAPPPRLGPRLPVFAPEDRTSRRPRISLRVRTDAPPPARGPPRLS